MIPEHIRRSGTPGALVIVSLYTVVAAGALWVGDGLPTAVRIPLALPVLLFAPGYAVVTALLPVTRRTAAAAGDVESPKERPEAGLSPVERGILAVVASIAVVPMVAFAVAVVVGVELGPILAGVAGVTVSASAVGLLRSPADTLAGGRRESGHDVDWTAGLTDTVTLLAVGITVVLLVASAAVAFVGSGGPTATEFYLANDPDAGDDPTYDLRIEHESDDRQRYTVVIATGGAGDPVELDRRSTVVGPDETAAETYRADPGELEANATLLFLLYEGDAPADPDPGSAHRVLKLSNVTTGQTDGPSVLERGGVPAAVEGAAARIR